MAREVHLSPTTTTTIPVRCVSPRKTSMHPRIAAAASLALVLSLSGCALEASPEETTPESDSIGTSEAALGGCSMGQIRELQAECRSSCPSGSSAGIHYCNASTDLDGVVSINAQCACTAPKQGLIYFVSSIEFPE
jgi:hypothetical protein